MATGLMLTREFMLARRENCGPEYDGHYIVGVKTTGVYCLPSCRPPRLAHATNIEFYASPEEARNDGLRPCKLCRPDDFYLGFDAGEVLVENLVNRIAEHPEQFHTARSMVCDSGVGTSKLHELFRTHYHTTPSELLTRKRVERARRLLLECSLPVPDIGFEVGFKSLSAFNANFRKYSATSPAAYRRMAGQAAFQLCLPRQYPLARLLAYLGRDAESLTDQVRGNVFRTALWTGKQPLAVEVTFSPGLAHCRVRPSKALEACELATLYDRLLGVLGLSGDPARFEAQVSGSSDLAPLIAGQRGLTVPLVAQPFDGLVWAIAGQQVRLPVAFAMRRRLVERAGTQVAPGLFLPPGAADVAALEADELARMGFTRSRSRYLANAARQVADGQLPLEEMGDASATRIERRLRDLPGIGPWSAGYVLMRSFGFQNAVPVGDSVLAHGLQQFFRLEGRPCADEMMRLMDRFSPYRSLATFHIWQRFGRAA